MRDLQTQQESTDCKQMSGLVFLKSSMADFLPVRTSLMSCAIPVKTPFKRSSMSPGAASRGSNGLAIARKASERRGSARMSLWNILNERLMVQTLQTLDLLVTDDL